MGKHAGLYGRRLLNIAHIRRKWAAAGAAADLNSGFCRGLSRRPGEFG
jgi:hypothetical protein